MALPRYSIRLEDLGALRVLAENLNDPRGVMTSIGALHKSMVSERFREQGKPRDSWDTRIPTGKLNAFIADIVSAGGDFSASISDAMIAVRNA